MTHPFDILSLDNGAKFIFTPCPGTKDISVAESLQTFKGVGAQAVITMMTMPELIENKAEQIPTLCADLEMDWYQLPVEDSCAPEEPFAQAFARHKSTLLDLIKSGATIVIHCHGGSGRTGLMAAILMLESGYDAQEIKTKIQQLRPKSLKSPVQVNYLVKHYSFDA